MVLSFSLFSLIAQTPNSFENEWAEVTKLINQGLPKSALEKVQAILAYAKKDNNQVQQLKAHVFICKIKISNEENGVKESIGYLESLTKASSPNDKVASSYLAEIYQSYFENNRYEISQRSIQPDAKIVDMEFWDSQMFIKKINELYVFSISDPKSTNNESQTFRPLLEQFGRAVEDVNEPYDFKYRPTLYELLVDRALAFFEEDVAQLPSNLLSFSINNPTLIGDLDKFLTFKVDTKTSQSHHAYTINALQNVLSKLKSKSAIDALAHYDLQRLKYVYGNGTFGNKDVLYLDVLEKSASKYSKSSYAGEYLYKIAEYHQNNSQDSTHFVKAVEWATKIVKNYPETPAAGRAQTMINSIKKPSINISVEMIYAQHRPMLMAIDHNNLSTVTIKIVPLPSDFPMKRNRTGEEIKSILQSIKAIHTQNQKIKLSDLYQSQKTELSIKGLSQGNYAVIAENDNVFQYSTFAISDIAYTTYTIKDKRHFYVVDRMTGKPLAKAKIDLFAIQYQNWNEPPTRTKAETITTDKTGHATVTMKQNAQILPIIFHGKNKLDYEYIYGDYYHEQNPYENRFAEIYTDRAIYRPGQIVYFKAILAKSEGNELPILLTGEKVTVSLKDANYQDVAKIELTSNKWGSISGQFALPKGGLNGQYNIIVNDSEGTDGQRGINVEEYKRPSFLVKADEIKESYKLGAKASVTGHADTYAGVAVANAQVEYTVKRGYRFPIWYSWYRFPYGGSETIITTGITKTDEKGQYTIDFDAIGDPTMTDPNAISTFNIEVKVTDSRGETQTTSHSINISNRQYEITTNIAEKTDVKQLSAIKLSATNLNGQQVEAKAKITITKLKEPQQVEINRYWGDNVSNPLPIDIYRKDFIQYPIPNKKTYESWVDEKVILNDNISTKDSLLWPKGISAGVYKIESSSTDKLGQEVKSIQYTVITDFGAKKFPKSQFVHHKVSHTSATAGETISIDLGTSQGEIYVHIVATYINQILLDQTVKVKDLHTIKIPVGNRNKGSIHIAYTYFHSSRIFTETTAVAITDPSRMLNIEYVTFRDKTIPGSKEKYSLVIKNKKGQAVESEVLAAMYDASLDAFTTNQWRSQFDPYFYSWINFDQVGFGMNSGMFYFYGNDGVVDYSGLPLPRLLSLNSYGVAVYNRSNAMESRTMMKSSPAPSRSRMEDQATDGVMVESNVAGIGLPPPNEDTLKKTEEKNPPQLRTNLNETVFFYPMLTSDAQGNLTYEFTINEAITKWKLMTLAHSKDLGTAYDERTVVTQKDIMVIPNLPRFMRDTDKIEITARVENTTDSILNGTADLILTDAVTGRDITTELVSKTTLTQVNIKAKSSETVSWILSIPEGKYSAIKYRIIAQAGDHSDGEENILPILTNRILVTESMPMWVRGKETKTFDFKSFLNATSTTKTDQSYSVEFTAHPIWFAIQAMPYIAAGQSITTDALAEKLYTNQLASNIVAQNPRIKEVFEVWKTSDPSAFMSQLEKNPQLRNVLIEETPWVLNAKSEAEQRRNIALLFDINNMAQERTDIIRQLKERQLPDGGFPWYKGDRSNVYTTLNVLELIGRLKQLGVDVTKDREIQNILANAKRYLDKAIIERYERLVESIKKSGGNLDANHLDDLSIHQLYTMTMYDGWKTSGEISTAYNYYRGQAQKYWTKFGITTQAMIGLTLYRTGDKSTTAAILKSHRERKTSNAEMGTYWNIGIGYNWQDLPISRQSVMIAFFNEADYNMDEIDDMKIWLLKQKQTNHWKSNKATVDAIHALLLNADKGSKATAINVTSLPTVEIKGQNIYASTRDAQAGTGYIYSSYDAPLNKELGSIKVTNPNENIAWGAAYYQYFENTDKVKSFQDTPLKLRKQYFKVESTLEGERILPVTNESLMPGSKVRVRIELSCDRSMEYIHMKDQRPSGFEPVNVISDHKYQAGMSYYETTKDVATHFFFSYLPKGSYVFEYDMFVVHKGTYTGGITSIESMYAPEFKSHSNGQVIKVGLMGN